MTFAEAILRTRKQLNMTQLEFAKASGMSLRALCRLEAGEEPRPNALIALADVSKDREGLGYYHALFDAWLQAHLVAQQEAHQRKRQPAETDRRLSVEELARYALSAEQNREAWERVNTIAQIAMAKCDDAKDFAALVNSLKGTFQSLANLVPARVAIAEEDVQEHLNYILGRGDNSSDRSKAEQAILHPEMFTSKKKAWAVVDAYIGGRNARENAKRLKAGLASLNKTFVAKKSRTK